MFFPLKKADVGGEMDVFQKHFRGPVAIKIKNICKSKDNSEKRQIDRESAYLFIVMEPVCRGNIIA
jgi:hypothetical protein